ncbi:COG4912 Predicted DNA alkylation repair enzyme [Candidatus Nanopelagicaceae bacterium]
MSTFKRTVLNDLQEILPSLGDSKVAFGAQAYMKGIAPFIGIRAPERRKVAKELARKVTPPTSDELGLTARALWKLPEREYQYLACDLIDIFIDCADKNFLADHAEFLISHKSWWDTVDLLGSAAVSPLTLKFSSVTLMRKWSKDSNMWLNRAAIQHQRGRKSETDIPLLLEFLDYHSDESEFFIAKAIGWALRDLSRVNNLEVKKFLRDHPELNRVAVREALKLGYK